MPPHDHSPFGSEPHQTPTPQQQPHLVTNPAPPQADWQSPQQQAQPQAVAAWVPPAASQPQPSLQQGQGINPVPVVKVLSTRGVEYAMMTLALWFGADAFAAILLVLINGGSNFTALSFP